MNDHDDGHSASISLCDELYYALNQIIGNLEREKNRKWCSFFQQDKKRFVYISHRKKRSRLEIWFLGEVEDAKQYPSLDIRMRTPTTGGFGKYFKARFYLDNSDQLQDAVNLLYRVSYSSSDPRIYSSLSAKNRVIKEELPILPSITVQSEEKFLEGERRATTATTRNSQLRIAAKRKWGLKCYCCGFDFEEFYGSKAKGFAIVHHLELFAGKDTEKREAVVEDVRVICANCHYVIHMETPPIDVDILKEHLSLSWSRWSDSGIQRNKESSS